MTPAETMVQAIEWAAAGPVVVFGSLPPSGLDLDLIVRDEEVARLGAALEAAGALRRGNAWAVIGTATGYVVEITAASDWSLSPSEVDALFASAEPLDGCAKLSRPAAAHTLLLLARIGVSAKRAGRLRAALAVPGARDEAERRAEAWGVDLASLDTVRRPRPALRAPKVVALSGLDGSGKSTQSKALASTLEALGYDVHVHWAPILQNRSIAALSSLARVLLRLVRRGGGGGIEEGASLVAQVETSSAKQRAIRGAWTTVVALANGTAHRRPALEHRGSGTVVIYDRFVLDSIVRIRFLYGRDERFATPRRLLRLLSPRPVAAFWLDVPGDRAYARKPEHWSADDLNEQRALYAEEHERVGVTRLDGERPPDELAAEIAGEVWRRL